MVFVPSTTGGIGQFTDCSLYCTTVYLLIFIFTVYDCFKKNLNAFIPSRGGGGALPDFLIFFSFPSVQQTTSGIYAYVKYSILVSLFRVGNEYAECEKQQLADAGRNSHNLPRDLILRQERAQGFFFSLLPSLSLLS